METGPNYLLIWVYWKATAFHRRLWLSYSLRALMLAATLTPWYANTQGDVIAPALMIVALDAITLGFDTMGRALTPLILSLVTAELLATLVWFVRKPREKQAKTEA